MRFLRSGFEKIFLRNSERMIKEFKIKYEKDF